jgi:hypothetical protein
MEAANDRFARANLRRIFAFTRANQIREAAAAAATTTTAGKNVQIFLRAHLLYGKHDTPRFSSRKYKMSQQSFCLVQE